MTICIWCKYSSFVEAEEAMLCFYLTPLAEGVTV